MFFSISVQKGDGQEKIAKNPMTFDESEKKQADISMGVLPLAFLYAICLYRIGWTETTTFFI